MRFFKVMLALLTTASAPAFAQALSASDLPQMHSTYSNNQARFKRDYVDKTLTARLPIHSITEEMFAKGSYRVGLGNVSGFSADVDCVVSDKPTIDKVMDWNKGDVVTVSGRVSDRVMGSIILRPCQVNR
jgi:hypothetical protein